MIVRPTYFLASDALRPELPTAETPLQRQILLWQRELIRRLESGEASPPNAKSMRAVGLEPTT
jgi:hypothetical protein